MSAVTMSACPPKDAEICEKGGGGYFLPLAWENEITPVARAVPYLLLLFWSFLGVAIVADVFMAGIEKVTSKKRMIVNKKTGTVRTVKVWNDTVANLTLMALGSSAPEILLNVIEICAGGFVLGPLGASTIVGSAAFNLLVISAVCVIAIEGGEVRYIKDLTVYSITAFFSVFAYIWLLFIVVVSTPEVVELWEAAVTFLLFPVLTTLSYLADIGMLSKREPKIQLSAMTHEEISYYEMKVLQKYGNGLSDEQIADLLQKEFGQEASRAAYRIKATLGAAKDPLSRPPGSAQVYPSPSDGEKEQSKVTTIQFASSSYTVMESIGSLEIVVERSGTVDEGAVKVAYKTVDGSAEGGKDFESTEGLLEFAPGVKSHSIMIPIINDADLEKDEFFKVQLVEIVGDEAAGVRAEVGDRKECEIRIIDDDAPGQLCFQTSLLKVAEDRAEDRVVQVTVERRNGSRGEVGISYKTEDDSAKSGMDYEEAAGTLTLKDGQAEATIEIVIKPCGRYEAQEKFRVLLEEPTGGATLVESHERDTATCTVVIESDAEARDRLDRVVKLMHMNWDNTAKGNRRWKEQFIDALSVRGGDDDDDEAGPPSTFDYFIHGLSIFWKLLFACIPPPDYCDGWLCFFSALMAIGVVTTFISDLANLVGCCFGIPAEITAITIVALGTSLPDTFASKTAATQDPYADASIGNVTGSNSVNVFLGLGLPWLMAAVYWQSQNGVFEVKAGNLGIGVAVFCCCALVAIMVLAARRKICGGELGGPPLLKWVSFGVLISLWVIYIVVSSLVVISNLGPCDR
jgi:solute carrier family 8 (sodium/calcium exchanger)